MSNLTDNSPVRYCDAIAQKLLQALLLTVHVRGTALMLYLFNVRALMTAYQRVANCNNHHTHTPRERERERERGGGGREGGREGAFDFASEIC